MSASQITDTIFMVRPFRFAFNAQTAPSNIFQDRSAVKASAAIHEKALQEFDSLVQKLRVHKIYVVILQDDGKFETPDSIFPNNWISFHDDRMILYPMLAENRRNEKRPAWISFLKDLFNQHNVIDFSGYEREKLFLEGTGSLVLDRKNKIAYANLSSRTNEKPLLKFCEEINYKLISFTVKDQNENEIYHTNVLMSIGEEVAVMCSEVIHDENERLNVMKALSAHHEVVEISYDQMMKFAGNMLLVKNRDQEKFWVMSEQTFYTLDNDQKATLQKDGNFIFSDLKTIESVGGGSARCMMCEIF